MFPQFACFCVYMHFLSALSFQDTSHCLVLPKQILIRLVILEIRPYGAKCLIQFTTPAITVEDGCSKC